jgi:carbonic anhydrase
MSNFTILEQILAANQGYLTGTARPLEDAGPFFLVIACIDPRLTGLLAPAMGLPRGRAMIIRVAGNSILPTSHDVQRSVAAAMYIRAAREIFVVGHTDCAMAAFSTQSVIESFRGAGVPRSAFGNGDLREWFGAFTDIEANVFQSIENLAHSGILPSDARLHGLIMDTITGKIEVLRKADPEGQLTPEPSHSTGDLGITPPLPDPRFQAAPKPQAISPGEPPPPLSAASKSQRGPAGIPGLAPAVRESAAPPESMAEALKVLADFIQRERQNPKLRPDLLRLRENLSKESDPFELLIEVARIARENAIRYPRVPGAVEYIAEHLKSGNAGDGRTTSTLRQILRY